MRNRFFSEKEMAALLEPWKWRMVSSLLPDEAKPLRDRSYEDWRKAHPDQHPHMELLLPLAGKAKYGLAGKVYSCEPGSIFIIGPEELHDQSYPPNSPHVRHLWCFILHDHLCARLLEIKKSSVKIVGEMLCLIPGGEAGADLPSLWQDIHSCPYPPELNRVRLQAAVAAILGRVMAEGFKPDSAEDRGGLQKQTVLAIQRHIERTGGKGASLDNLAHIAGFSKFHFLRLFKRHTGMGVHAYVERCRRQRMEAMFSEGRSCKEVSAALGFSCPAAFSRWKRKSRKVETRRRG